jgi:organic radical activating enzyme
MRIRYSEIFYSFQGEAKLAGTPAVWLRFFGCNLNCNGFGQQNPTDPSTYQLPYETFNVDDVKDVNELPVWKFGCDSSYSWSQRFKHLAHDASPAEIADRLIEANKSEHNPLGLFIHPKTEQPIMLCFTGGEPMMQQKAMIEILRELNNRNNAPLIVTVETNATRPLSDDLKNFITWEFPVMATGNTQWHWSMSPKLFTVSGEENAVNIENIFEYILTRSSSVLKFVCNGTEENWTELDTQVNCIRLLCGRHTPEIWVMPVGATKDAQEDPYIGDLCIEAMNRGYKVATRNHCYVFGNVIGR